MIFGSTDLIGTSARCATLGVWNSQRKYCCQDDAAGEAGILASGSVITWSRMVSTCIVITE